MYSASEILNKINKKKGGESGIKFTPESGITLPDIMIRSFSEVEELAGDSLTWGEKHFIYQQAQQELKKNKMAESRILSRANPQLSHAIKLGIRQSSMLGGYDHLFPARASNFVMPGSVASMFSPAGYLTELYRESRNLHPDTSAYHLDVRRPDLASLSLSQKNMDDELSTLSLSNELLLNNIKTNENKDYNEVTELLATWRQTGSTPYNQAYEATRQAILLQDPDFTVFSKNPAVAAKIDTASLLSIQADISPELLDILTEEITEENADSLIIKNFVEDKDVMLFQNVRYLARYYGLTDDETRSLLGLVIAGVDVDPDAQLYKSDKLVSLLNNDDGELSAILIRRTNGHNAYQFGFAELVPIDLNKYIFNFSIVDNARAGSMQVGTHGKGSRDIFNSTYYDVQRGVPISLPVNLSDEQTKKTVTINVTRQNGVYYANVNYDISSYPFSIFLLKLNKLIRLYKATGIAFNDIHTVVASNNNELNINAEVLSQLFRVNASMQNYGIDAAKALVLSGSLITQTTRESHASLFTRLFNNPPLNNQMFSANGTTVNLKPDEVRDTYRTGVLKRAFKVNDTELYTLWLLAGGEQNASNFTCNINNLSSLFRVSLLAELHGLSVTELAALLSVSPYATQAIDMLSAADVARLISFVDQYTRWLKQMNWSVSDLYLMTTDRYSTTLSPDIENLLTTLKNGLANRELSGMNEAGLISAAAPFIAAAMQLDSAQIATAILTWLRQLKPQGLSLWAFLTLVVKDKRSEAETVQLVSYCQKLGQLTLFVRKAALRASELSWVVDHPTIMTEKATVVAHDIAMLRDLTLLHDVLSRCGASASEIITSLSGKADNEKNNLAVRTVASALNLDEQALSQALRQCSSYRFFYSWIHLRDALQWVDAATRLSISPGSLARLLNLMHTALTQRSGYADWLAASEIIQAGLSTQQMAQQQQVLDEALSTAASGYVIQKIAPSWVTDREKLYSWLLIDNQVSAQVITTRVAEAIAAIQLYVNRALAGQEDEVDYRTRSRQFFTDWDVCNKRYSTWAGMSELVYYPENYIDPTMRLGQTGMMDEMLQSLSQSQLTSDTVEAAFKTYMTRFEEIANLDIVSGYHDSVSDHSGTTYIIGCSPTGDYYWRSADINKMSDGKLPSNAWSEWKKIAAGISPVTNLVRPVVFQSRLYVVWVESREVATTSGNTTLKSVEYLLKYAHIQHDSTWSAPVTITPGQDILPPANVAITDTGIYCAQDAELEKLYIYFYKKERSYSDIPRNIVGLSISADGSSENITSNVSIETAGYIYQQLDTTTDVRLNTPYTGGETRVSVSGVTSDGGGWGYRQYTNMSGSSLSNVTATVSAGHVAIKFDATVRIVFNGFPGSRSQTQVDMMKLSGRIGGGYYLPTSVDVGAYASSYRFTTECVVNRSANKVFFLPGNDYLGLTILGPNPRPQHSIYYAISNQNPAASNLATLEASGLWSGSDSRLSNLTQNILVCRSNPFPQAGYDFKFSDFVYLDTNVRQENVKLSVAGQTITAVTRPKFSFEETLFNFSNNTVYVPLDIFNGNSARVDFTVEANAPSGDKQPLGREVLSLTLTRMTRTSVPLITLNRTSTYAQYLQYGVHRIRVNTLFAKQLVARANSGLNAILSMETQQLLEPKLGKGFYVDFVLPPYDAKVHGNSPDFTLNLKHVVDNNAHVVYSGQLTESEYSVRLFVPLDEKPLNVNYCAKVFLRTRTAGDGSWKGPHFQYTDNSQTAVRINPSSDISMFNSVTILSDTSEPMDFSGANALYFWEMFYYVPMMVFRRYLSEGKFTEATQWIKYIWSPEGYLHNDVPALYQWNVRPLQEETTWHTNPLDSLDPDAVAQADPMHYKVATFMSWLDLLIARGDSAYRQLERDTLNEAKMWYVQALELLGEKPHLPSAVSWSSPTLRDAANETIQTLVQQRLLSVRQQVVSGQLFTANSLTSLFLPQQNERLAEYWQTLAQRLYNLRHNLSIDGNPLSLSIYATPADPAALLSAAVRASQGGTSLPASVMPAYRFPVILESSRAMVSQLSQFGTTLLAITERQDAEALSELLQNQGSELILQSIAMQSEHIAEIDADRATLQESLRSAQSRLDSYTRLYDENINTGEKRAMDLYLSSSVITASATAMHMAGAALEMVPNIYGMAVGGARYGALINAAALGLQISGDASNITAERISQSEVYRRRRQEWEMQRNGAESDVKQIDAQLEALAIRHEAAVLQKTYLTTQQSQMQAQMIFLQNRFTSTALYNWLRGKLAAIYYQFYDLTVSRCLMAEEAYKWTFNHAATFIRPGAWQGAWGGLMAGENLMLNLAQMEQAYLQRDERQKEVTRTVCLSEVYAALSSNAFVLADELTSLVTTSKSHAGVTGNGLTATTDMQLQATLTLSDLKIGDDYPASLGATRRIKQISVTLPALTGPYQDVQAVLSYGGDVVMPRGCEALAVSHGINDSGQFQLDFSDGRWLPFEGIPVDNSGVLTLSFPMADDKQKALLLTLTDIILHIRYTIVS
ncbi:neuraminidase-like domain-containing protein [Erwinia mallotivora]|uniref:Tc toxin subunit A-related protein n=1 Tax=Erwinia mallotivora TaxID=69222 RepID=UPI0021C0A827|nr:neuraminidase-like domain-containing protein [Erwinia mallotivora]